MYTGKLIRVSVLSRRNPDMPEDDYHKYWADVHGPLVAHWLERYGIVKYTQVSGDVDFTHAAPIGLH